MSAPEEGTAPESDMSLWDIRVVVDRIEGRSVCGMRPGDWCEVTESSRLRIPEGGHFCLYALQAALPLIPAKQRDLPAGDWLEREERLIMRIERTRRVDLRADDLT